MLGDDPSVLSATVMESCAPESCQNGGICSSNMESGIKCLCLPGFSGSRCQTEANDCLNVNLPVPFAMRRHTRGWDTRMRLPDWTHWSPIRWMRQHWRLSLESLPEQRDVHRRDQRLPVHLYTGIGFDRIDCSDEINECEPSSPCHNIATRVNGVGNYTCLCPAEYEGRDCQTDVDEYQLPTTLCGIHSTTCTDLVGDNRCVCEPGWTGRHCDVDIDECADSPCLNNGTCLNQLNAFQCQCPNGFLGTSSTI
jgi:hypothetical protein